tara:strand:- start:109 stop:390 length:282 start_codon:yes stop_codon:yes gene_type:complete
MKKKFKLYKAKKTYLEMRPYVAGEDMSNVIVSRPDRELMSGMEVHGTIVRSPLDRDTQWFMLGGKVDILEQYDEVAVEDPVNHSLWKYTQDTT